MSFSVKLIESIFLFLSTFIFIYMLMSIAFYCYLLIFSLLQLKKVSRLNKMEQLQEYYDVNFSKPVSIIVPVYNEELGVIESVRSLLSLKYPEIEIIIVNDGSTDRTFDLVIDHFKMEEIPKVIHKQLQSARIKAVYQSSIIPFIYLIDKENGGKADALNAGINVTRYPYFCSIDGDSILETDSLLKVMQPINESQNEVIACGGSIQIANGCDIQMGTVLNVRISKKPIVIMQVIEYLRAFLLGRVGLSKYNMLLIISGAFSVFSKEWVVKAGGYSVQTVGEDMEIVVRLHRLLKEEKVNKRIEFVPDPVCWTEAPESLRSLYKQRSRWHRGLLDSLWTHRKMMLNPKYGQVGLLAFPYFALVELWGPIIECLGYLIVLIFFLAGDTYIQFAILVLLVMVLYGSVLSMVSVLLEIWSLKRYPKIRDIYALLFYSLLETFWYRPLTAIWRCLGFIQWLMGYSQWDRFERKGLSQLTRKTSKPKYDLKVDKG